MERFQSLQWLWVAALTLASCAGGEDRPATSAFDGDVFADATVFDATLPTPDAAQTEPDMAPPPVLDHPPRWGEMARIWVEGPSADGLTLRWTAATDDNAVTAYRILRDGLVVSEVSGDATMTSLADGVDAPEHVFRVVAGDAAGHWSPGPSTPYRRGDLASPMWPEDAALFATELSARGVTVTWPAAQDDVGVAQYLLSVDDADPIALEATRYRTTDVTQRQTLRFSVWAVDATGNQSPPLHLVVTIPGGTAPIWPDGSAIHARAPGADWIDLQWTAAVDDEAVTQYTLYNGLVPVNTVAGDQLQGRISDLAPYTTYHLSVSAEDADGNRTPGPRTNVQTADLVAPSWPQDARVVASDVSPTGLTLGWTSAQDDVAIDGYVVRREGVDAQRVDGTSVRVDGLSPWTQYRFTIHAVDPSGNVSAAGLSIALRTPDASPPVWPQEALRALALGPDSVRLDWAPAIDDVMVTEYRVSRFNAADIRIDGNTHTLEVEGLAPWTRYTFHIEAVDAAGNASLVAPGVSVRTLDQSRPHWAPDDTLRVTDLTPEELVLRWPPPQDDVAITMIMVYRDDRLLAALPGDATHHAVSDLTPWTQMRFEIRAGDAAGNWAQESLSLQVQTPDWVRPNWGAAPALSFDAVTPNSLRVRWPAAVDDVGVVYRVNQDGVRVDTLPQGTTEWAVAGLAPWRTYTFSVDAIDAAGNVAEPTLSGRVRTADDLAPTWPADATLSAENMTPNAFTLSWPEATDDVGLSYVLHRNGAIFGTFPEGTTRVELNGLTPATAYSLTLYAVDAAGNQSPRLRLDTQTPDNIAPWWPPLPTLSVSNLGPTGLTLSWPRAEDDVSLTYVLRMDGVEIATLPQETRSMDVPDLSTWVEYTFDIVAVDPLGNRSAVLSRTIRTPDVQAPSWGPGDQLQVSDLDETRLTLTWPDAVDDIGLSYLVYQDGRLLETLPPAVNTLAVANLTPWRDYQFEVAALDAAGNLSVPPLTVGVRTPDSTTPDWGPEPTLGTENLGPNQLTLRWSPATDNVGLVYRVRQNDVLIATLADEILELAVDDLSPWEIYVFRVDAVDPAGNRAPNGPPDVVIQTPDESPPRWGPDDALTAEALDAQSVTLQWPPAMDDVGVTTYQFDVDGEPLGALPGDQQTITINELEPDTDYAFAVMAIDAATNASADPLTLTIRTPRMPCPEPLDVETSATSAAPFGFVRFDVSGGTGAYEMNFTAAPSGGDLLSNPFSYLAGPTGGVIDTIQFSDSGCRDTVDVDIQVYPTLRMTPQRVTLPLGGCVSLQIEGGSGAFDFSVVSNRPIGQIDEQGIYTNGGEQGRDILRVVDRQTGESLESIVTVGREAHFSLGGDNLYLPVGGHLDPTFEVGTGQFTLESESDVITISEDGRRLIANRVGTTRVTATDPTVGCLGPNEDQPATATVTAHVVSAIAPPGDLYVRQSYKERGVLIAGRDFNGDGFDDLVAGSRELHFALHESGVVALYLGGPNGLAETPAQVFGGAESGGAFGSAIAAGDFNGDARLDLVVGAEHEQRVGVGIGAVYVYYGQPDGTLSTTPDRTLATAGDNVSNFGTAIAVCDFDGDGTEDIAVGSSGARYYLNNALPYNGSVSVFYGSDTGLEGAPRQVLWGRLPTVLGWSPTSKSWFGQSLAAGDYDGDGICELAVSAFGDGGASNDARFATNERVPPDYLKGTVFLFEGRRTLGVSETPFRHVSIAAGAPNENDRFRGTFGAYMALEDLDDDGRAELVLPHHVFRGGPIPAEPELELTLAATADWADPFIWTTQGYHHGPMTLVDLNGDGLRDLVTEYDGLHVYLGQEEGFFAPAYDPALSFRLGLASGNNAAPRAHLALNNERGRFSQLADVYSMVGNIGSMEDPANPGQPLLVLYAPNRFSKDAPGLFGVRHGAQGLELSIRHLPSKRAGSMIGDSVLLTDVTGDGTDDFVLGAPGIFANEWGYRDHEGVQRKAATQGGVFVYAMDDGEPPAEPTAILDPHRAEAFGEALAAAGDFDGDGVGDLAISQASGSQASGPFVACNGADPVYVDGKWDCPVGVAHASGGNHQVQLVNVPDECDPNRQPNSVGIYRGADIETWRAGGETGGRRPAFVLQPPFDADYFGDIPLIGGYHQHGSASYLDGVPLAGQFDFNGDGRADVAVGAPGHDSVNYVSAYGGRGGAFVYFGRAPVDARVTEVVCTPDLTFTSSDRSSLLGWAMTGMGDLDGDGCDELAITAPGGPADFQNKPMWRGFVHIVLGHGPNCARQAGEYLTLEGQVGGAGMGWAILGGHDLDGDQIDDLVLGAPHAALGGNFRGLFFAIRGSEVSALLAADMFRPLVNGALDLDQAIAWPIDHGTPEGHFGPRGLVNRSNAISGLPNTLGASNIERFGAALAWVPGVGDHGIGVAVGSHRKDIGNADNAGEIVIYEWIDDPVDGKHFQVIGRMVGDTKVPNGGFGSNLTGGTVEGLPTIGVGSAWASPREIEDQVQNGAGYLLQLR